MVPRLSTLVQVALGSMAVTLAVTLVAFVAWLHASQIRGQEIVAESLLQSFASLEERLKSFEIRLAVLRFAGSRPLCCGHGTADLTSWLQLRGHFDEGSTLWGATAAADDAGTILAGANHPWSGDFELVVDPAVPRQFGLRITLTEDPDALLSQFGNGALDATVIRDDKTATIQVAYEL